MTKVKGARRTALKKRYDKWKRIEKNNYPDGQKFRMTSLKDLRRAELRAKGVTKVKK